MGRFKQIEFILKNKDTKTVKLFIDDLKLVLEREPNIEIEKTFPLETSSKSHLEDISKHAQKLLEAIGKLTDNECNAVDFFLLKNIITKNQIPLVDIYEGVGNLKCAVAMATKINKAEKGTCPLKLNEDDLNLLRSLQSLFAKHFYTSQFSKNSLLKQIAQELIPEKNIKDNIQQNINSGIPLVNFMIKKHKE